jgi:hypothetical protein
VPPPVRPDDTTPPRTTTLKPAVRGVRPSHSGVNSTSSLGSVHVAALSGRSVGRSPPRPPHAGIAPGVRLIPSSSRIRPPTRTNPSNRSAVMRGPDASSSSADRPRTGSLSSLPPADNAPTGSPSPVK